MGIHDDQTPATKGDIQNVLQAITGMNGDITGMKTEMRGMKTEISGINTWMAGLDVRMTRLNERVTEMSKNVATKEGLQKLEKRMDKRFAYVNDGIDLAINNICALDGRFVNGSDAQEKRFKKLEGRFAS